MRIDFRRLLSDNGIEYVTGGQHSAGNIGVNCPLCARTVDPDPSHHLGINLTTGAWNCWRNPQHRGRKPHSILKALCGMPYAEVDKLLGVRTAAPTSEFDSMFANGNDPFAIQHVAASRDTLSPAAQQEFMATAHMASPLAKPHREYLRRRGIHEATMTNFGIRAGIAGRWAGRVIFPVLAPVGANVATWTARAINHATTPKYLALARTEGANLKSILYNAPRLSEGGKTVVVVEGPMDVVVLQQLASDTPITCTFGLSVSDNQIALLKSAGIPRILFLFDSTAYSSAESCAHRAGGDAIDYLTLFGRDGDPGDLTDADIPALRSRGIM